MNQLVAWVRFVDAMISLIPFGSICSFYIRLRFRDYFVRSSACLFLASASRPPQTRYKISVCLVCLLPPSPPHTYASQSTMAFSAASFLCFHGALCRAWVLPVTCRQFFLVFLFTWFLRGLLFFSFFLCCSLLLFSSFWLLVLFFLLFFFLFLLSFSHPVHQLRTQAHCCAVQYGVV